MTIMVKFIGAFRRFSGRSELELDCRGPATVGELINEIGELPQIERSLIDQQLENMVPNALILVNNREISVLNGLETTLKDGDEVILVPVVHGG
jgi:MoaD family protein